MKLGLAVAAFALSASAVADAAEKARHVFRPVSQWTVEYADDSCRLIRDFTEGKDKITLAFERFEPGTSMRLGLAGSALRGWTSASNVKFRYLPDGAMRQSPLLRTQLADGREAFLVTIASLFNQKTWEEIRKEPRRKPDLAAWDREEEALAAAVASIVIFEGFQDEPELQLGSMKTPIKAMQTCAYDLFKSWGVDAQAVALMTRPAEPINKRENWLTSSDYPSEMLRAGRSGTLQMLLIVGPEGRVEQCHFDVDKPGQFEAAACEGIKSRAKFRPALDADGRPMRSFWRERVRFNF